MHLGCRDQNSQFKVPEELDTGMSPSPQIHKRTVPLLGPSKDHKIVCTLLGMVGVRKVLTKPDFLMTNVGTWFFVLWVSHWSLLCFGRGVKEAEQKGPWRLP